VQLKQLLQENHLLLSEGLEAIDPAVANTVTELLFLPVENMLRVEKLHECQFRLQSSQHRANPE